MQTWMWALVTGIVWVGFWPSLIAWQIVLLAALGIFYAGYCFRQLHWPGAPLIFNAGLLLLGICWHLFCAESILTERLPLSLEGLDLDVTGTVVSIPEPRDSGQRFQFRIEESTHELHGRRLLLNSYGEYQFQGGQRWHLVVRLRQPHGAANPGAFDYEGWLFQQNIAATGYVRESTRNRRLGDSSRTLLTLRARLRERLLAITEGLAYQPVLLALTLGDRSLLTDAHWELFSQTGTNHLVVISGLHIALVTTLCFQCLSLLWRRSARLTLWVPAAHAGALAGIATGIAYAALAGFTLPTQRAVIMVSVFAVSRLLAHRVCNWFSFQLALLLVLVRDPLAANTAGFWLSFVAVAALLLLGSRVYHSKEGNNNKDNKDNKDNSSSNDCNDRAKKSQLHKTLRNWVLPQGIVFIGLLVPLGFWLGEVSLLAPLVNVIAIPVVGWLVVPLALLGSVFSGLAESVSSWLLFAADRVFAWLSAGLLLLVNRAEALGSWPVNPLPGHLLIAAALGALLLTLPMWANSRWLGMVLLAPLLIRGPQQGSENLLEMHILDVGQGLSVLLRTAEHNLLYDAGPAFPGGFDSGTAIVYPVLRRLGVTELDRLIVSHGDNDHAGGVQGVLDTLPVRRVQAGEPLPGVDREVHPCQPETWNWDGVSFRILHPGAGSRFRGNNSSCVLLVSAAGFQALLPGDIDASIERRLLAQLPDDDRLEVLVSAHHGSNTSSSESLLARLQPVLVLHSAGYRNQFGHPAARVQARFQRFGSRQLTTSGSGMISILLEASGQPPGVRLYRQSHRRYWHWSDIQATGR